ncbi:MAG: DNA/RNA non-specific endonuclease [Pyrinomonadaceae bacterium]
MRPNNSHHPRLRIGLFNVGSGRKPSAFVRRHLIAITVIAFLIGLPSVVILIPRALADTSTPVNIATFGVPVTENFNTLASSGTSSTTPAGWGFSEAGTNANTTYTAGTGSSATGDTYSFGATSNTERALGGLQSGTLIPTIGAAFTNNTGGTITSLDISYTGEQWRLGALARTDRLDFQISTDATTLASGTYTDVNALDFTAPITGPTVGALDGNAAANRTTISRTITGLSIANGATFFIRWTDLNAAGSDDGLAVDDFSLAANGNPGDQAPVVTTTVPTNGATDVATGSNISINFSESVNATASSFTLECPTGSPQTFALSSSPAITFTLDPATDLPASTICTVTVIANQITDTDTNDPPDQMASNATFSFTTASPPPPVAQNIIINEIDADTPGTDTAEFIELYDGGVGNTSLAGLVVVLFNGNGDVSYNAFDLDGHTTDANGYFVLGDNLVPGRDLVVPNGFIQNGQDAVALYAANATDFPNGTAVSTLNLQDAIVYDNGQADDAGLLVLLNAGEPQVNEGGDVNSIGRCPNGSGGARNTSSYTQGAPSPDGTNNCPIPPQPSNSVIVVSQLYGGGGNNGATYQNDYVELYNRGTTTVDIGGWSLQYASADGSGWDSNKQPLGGTIAPGEYYLIALGSGGANGATLPPANIEGEINMSGTNGKIALVSNFDGLVGNCPTSDPDVMDFVGYGNADCKEGSATAPSPSNTTAILRKVDGAQDTDNNGNDFVTGAPNPRRTAPIVELGPLVLSTDPRTNGFNAPRDASITVTFTEPVDVVGSWFDITCASGQHNSATFAGGGKQHVITPNLNFVAGEQCTVTIFKDQVHDQDTDDSGPNTDTLPANYTWSFTVSTGTAPPYPQSVHLTMGNPNGATADTNQPNNYLMEKPEYSLSYNRDRGGPNWVSWHLSDEWIGTLTRVDTFRPDPAVPPDWYRVQSFDFVGSGFDRGHMVPNADRDKETSIPINQATFLMSNMLAQAPDNNQGPWAEFEGYLRTLLPADEVYIVAGGVGTGGSGSNGGLTMTIANGHVTVPAQTWKVALVIPKDSGDDVSRVTCGSRTIAILMPNTQGIRSDPWENFVTTVDAVEALTGYDFFSSLPDAVENCVEAGNNGTNPPGTANQSANTSEDTSVQITLDAVRSNNNTLTYSIVSGPLHGSLGSISAASCTSGACTATVTYNPGLDYTGSDSFTFKAGDGAIDSNVSTVSITITEVNDPPTAADDSKSTNEDTPLSFSASDLTANDNLGPANESSQLLTVTTVIGDGNTHGSVQLNSGMVTYTPAADYNGPASFTYTVCDDGTTNGAPDSKCAGGTVNVTVNPENDAPVAGNESYSTDWNTILNVPAPGVLANDADIDGGALSAQLVSNVSHGLLVLNSDGSFTYTPVLNFAGTDSFSYRAFDGADYSNVATVTITVNCAQLTSLGPASVWIGLKNSDDLGTKFDLLAEVLKNGTVVGSGQLNDVPGGGSGFNNAVQRTINQTLSSSQSLCPGDILSIRLSVRVAASSGHSSGTARLWYNDAAANSRFAATIGGVTSSNFLRSSFALAASAGPGPKATIDVAVNRNVDGNPFKPFGTWSISY